MAINYDGTRVGVDPSYADIARDWNLWCDYVDPGATMTEAEFNSMTIDEKVDMQTNAFGEEWSICPSCEGGNLSQDLKQCFDCGS